MKALVYDRFGPPEVLEIRERPTPEPGPGEVLVRVHAIPVGPGDCKLRAGELRHFVDVAFPKVPGRYASGVVLGVGDGVAWPRPGDEVVLASLHRDSGTAAEQILCAPAQMASKPAGLSHVETAAFVQGAVTAWACLVEAGQIARGERLLVLGAAGAVGSACVELGRHLGVQVTGVCRAADRQFVLDLGADDAIAYDLSGALDRVLPQDIVVDLVGGAAHARSRAALRPGGRIVYVHADPIPPPADDRRIEVVNAPVGASAAVLDAVSRLADRGVFQARVALARPLARASELHALMERRAIRRGRAVLALG